MTQHKQALANVKTLVDASLKDIIEALNKISDLWTFSSCEGDKEEWAEISLVYGNANHDYTNSARIANDLFNIAKQKGCYLDITLEWDSDAGYYPIIRLVFDRDEINNVCDTVYKLLEYYKK
jgi:hypothetical protein